MLGLYCHWKRPSLRKRGQEKVSVTLYFKFKYPVEHFTVPVIAIFTKFDDLMTQIYDINQDDDVNRQNAEEQVEQRFRKPLYEFAFPPRADVCFEGKYWLISCQGIDHMSQCSTLLCRSA
jgi:hypothetical protein